MKNRTYEHVWKGCSICEEETDHIVEASVTTCTKCNLTRDDDADEILGKED